MNPAWTEELRQVRDALNRLDQRLRSLEQQSSAVVAEPAARVETPTQPLRPIPTRPARAEGKTTAVSSDSLESRIGRDWLNRIGITSLVLGVVFFILYSFRYFGPVVKIATGWTIALALLLGGTWLERRDLLRWYGRSLIAGGWALLYFTCYAMHHITSVRLIHSPVVDLLLLSGVAAGAVMHSLKYRSQTFTALALLLGFATTAVSQVNVFTLIASTVLIVALVGLILSMRWERLLAYGAAVAYAVLLIRIGPQIDSAWPAWGVWSDPAIGRFWLKAGFLTLYWAAFHLAACAFDEDTPQRRRILVGATLFNGAIYVGAMLEAIPPAFRDSRWLFLLWMSGVYLTSALFGRERRLASVSTVCLLLGLSWLTLAIPLKATGRWIGTWWILEVPVLVIAGLVGRRPAMRAFAIGIAALVTIRLLMSDLWSTAPIQLLYWSIPDRVFQGLLAAAAFWICSEAYRHPRGRAESRPWESQANFGYLALACMVGWVVTLLEAPARWLPQMLALEATGLVALGWRRTDPAVRGLGLAGWLGVGWLLLVDLILDRGWEAATISGVIALLYAMAWAFRRVPARAAFEAKLPDAFTMAGSVVLTALLGRAIERDWLSVAWGAEGLGVLGVGFVQRDRMLRLSGLGVFGLLIGKILLIDLAGADTIYRILSFIAAGVVLLLASFVYTKWTATNRPD